ncbi:MAG: hypothetical protein SangKO_067870 [Sandaracinaceae bacterium]
MLTRRAIGPGSARHRPAWNPRDRPDPAVGSRVGASIEGAVRARIELWSSIDPSPGIEFRPGIEQSALTLLADAASSCAVRLTARSRAVAHGDRSAAIFATQIGARLLGACIGRGARIRRVVNGPACACEHQGEGD